MRFRLVIAFAVSSLSVAVVIAPDASGQTQITTGVLQEWIGGVHNRLSVFPHDFSSVKGKPRLP